MAEAKTQLSSLLTQKGDLLLGEWTAEQLRLGTSRISTDELRVQCRDFLSLLSEAVEHGDPESLRGEVWTPVKKMLSEVSRSRSHQGFSPSETATFVFSLKRPLFKALWEKYAKDPTTYAHEIWTATSLLDNLGLFTTEAYQKSREELISRQQAEMLELSTPVVKLWDGILALPMIGTLDSSRTQVVMESLLQKIMETGSEVAIIDITGVPTVDTLVAQHLIKTVTAARLMGADCIISGIRPQIAATIVHLGVDLSGVSTKATLADAFILALDRSGRSVKRPHRQDPREVRA